MPQFPHIPTNQHNKAKTYAITTQSSQFPAIIAKPATTTQTNYMPLNRFLLRFPAAAFFPTTNQRKKLMLSNSSKVATTQHQPTQTSSHENRIGEAVRQNLKILKSFKLKSQVKSKNDFRKIFDAGLKCRPYLPDGGCNFFWKAGRLNCRMLK